MSQRMTTTAAAGFATADPTTTTTTTEVRPPSVVSLVWKEEAVEENISSSSAAMRASATSTTWKVSLQDMPGVAASAVPVPDDNNNNRNNKEEGVDLVWQLARQQRKVQHARRVGQIVERKHLAVVYEDAHVVVVDKPGGVLTVPGLRQHASLLDAVHAYILLDPADSAKKHTPDNNNNNNNTLDDARHTQPAHRIVHRLDMDTSGLVVFGKTLTVTKVLQASFRQHDDSVTKVYEAVVVGHVPMDAGTIDLPLQRDIEHAPFMRVATPSYEQRARQKLALLHADGRKKQWTYQKPKPSVTRFTVVRRGYYPVEATTPIASCSARSLPFTVLELQPVTGRTHQLRVHCAALGFPIIGDPTYGWHGEAAPAGGLRGILRTHDGVTDALLAAWNAVHVPNVDPLCLHAARLSLPHPHDSQQIMAWSTPAPFLARFD